MKVPFLDLSIQHKQLRTPILEAITATYDANRFCLGKDVEDFEKTFASTFGYSHVLGMNSGTAPLHVACMVAGFKARDEVITSPFTFISSAWGISYVGATPVFADIEDDTFNIDPVKLESAITPRTKGLVVVHLFGQPARMKEILAIAKKHNLFVIEDCAQAVGAKYENTSVGNLGDCGTFSFYPTKNLAGCGEGGAFVSRFESNHIQARQIRVHGSNKRYYHDIIGGNFRMDGFQAAALNVKLPHLASWTERRQTIASMYRAGIKSVDIKLPQEMAYGASVYHQFTIKHPKRDLLRAHLTQLEVGTDLIYPVPLHLQKCYHYLGYKKGSFPKAELSAETCLSLPIFPELTDAQVEHVINSINSF